MGTLDLILILIIGYIMYLMFRTPPKKQNTQNDNQEKFDANNIESDDNYDYLEELLKFSREDLNKFINPYFTEGQFHNDYRDVITAFNNVAPSQKQIFNQGNIPVKFSNPPFAEVKRMLRDFIKEVNQNILTKVPDVRQINSGWDEVVPEKRVQSGWEKQMEKLGLPTSIYSEPICKGKIRLVAVDHVEKYETEDEIRYICYMFIQKKNVRDQLLVKVSFVIDKRFINKDRKFFDETSDSKKHEENVDRSHVVIEEIFIIGSMSDKGTNKSTDIADQFYNFAGSGFENNEFIDQNTIMKELMHKFRERSRETNNFNSALDEEGRNFHKDLPNLRNYKSYQATTTIYDDFEDKNLGRSWSNKWT